LEDIGEILREQKIWERLSLPKDYYFERQLFCDPMIFFIINGSVNLKINDVEEYKVSSHEMFMAQCDNSYEITILEQTQLLTCRVPIEAWYAEQKWIDRLIPNEENVSDTFLKLPINEVMKNYLVLMDVYLNEKIYSYDFFEMKRQEMFFLLFFYYQKNELVQFLHCILSKDIQFKKFVMANYLNAGNVQALAKLANYSTSGFIKKFQKCFNDSPYKWMQKQKAKLISFEINRGVKSLQEIANEYKFSSYQHFSVFCKAQLGAPPTIILEKSS